ncbi:AAA family ATPase [Fulvimarina sp. MAC3]
MDDIIERVDLASGIRPPAPVHVIGRAGTGKSTALRMIAKERGYHYTEAEYASKSVEGLYASILRDCTELYDVPKWRAKKVAAVEQMLHPRQTLAQNGEWDWVPSVLVVDEIQQVELTCLRQLLQTAERAGALLILAGNERGLASGRGRPAEDLEPITSRLAIRIKIEGCSKRDCELIASKHGVEGMPAFRACVAYGAAHNLRELVSLLEIARQMATGPSIDESAVHHAAMVKHGKKEAVKLLKAHHEEA